MKKKILAIGLVVCMLVVAIGSATMAYFTDTEEATNVFTVGNIDIELTEEVGVTDGNDVSHPEKVQQGENFAIYNNILATDVMQKEATVTNTGSAPAYVRVTVILNNYDLINSMIEYYEDQGKNDAEIEDLVDEVFNGWGMVYSHNNGINANDMRMTIPNHEDDNVLRVDSTFTTSASDGSYHFSRDNWFTSANEDEWKQNSYVGGFGSNFAGGYYAKILNDYELCYTYYLKLDKGEEATLFKGLTCPEYFDQEQAAMFDGLQIEIYADAIQAEGFADEIDAFEALELAHPLSTIRDRYVTPGTPVATAAELTAAIAAAEDGDTIVLTDDITGDVTAVQRAGVKVTVDGNGHTFAGVLTVDGKSKTYTTAGLTVKNMVFKADSISADACIRLGDGTNATRYTCNVTVEDCTFDVPGAVGVKSYTGGDKNLTITGCTATANCHSLVQAKGIDGILVENCKVYSKNGLNFNNSTNVTVSNCEVDVKGYAVRFGESSGGVGAAETYLIKDCTLKSANDDGDATIILRGTADYATLTIENTIIVGTPDITNTANGATVVK